MFGINPKGVLYTNGGYRPSFKRMVVVILRPFRASVSWLCHFIPLYGMLVYSALSGLSHQRNSLSPEGAIYANDGHSPSDKRASNVISPKGATYTKDGYGPWDMRTSNIISPERAIYVS